jgi:hypothetical protein
MGVRVQGRASHRPTPRQGPLASHARTRTDLDTGRSGSGGWCCAPARTRRPGRPAASGQRTTPCNGPDADHVVGSSARAATTVPLPAPAPARAAHGQTTDTPRRPRSAPAPRARRARDTSATLSRASTGDTQGRPAPHIGSLSRARARKLSFVSVGGRCDEEGVCVFCLPTASKARRARHSSRLVCAVFAHHSASQRALDRSESVQCGNQAS